MNWTFRALLGFSTVFSLVLIILLAGQVASLREDIAQLETTLATKDDLARVSVPSVKLYHEEKCTSCHTERRFAGEHNVRGEMEAALEHMRAMPDARFTDEEMAKIHASLELLRCASCHGQDQLRLLALKTEEQRMDVIQRMAAKPDSKLEPDEIESIHAAYQRLFGF